MTQIVDHGLRMENIFKKFLDDYKEKFENVEKTNNYIVEDLKELKLSLFNHVVKSCPTQAKWIQAHGKMFYDEHGIKIEIKDNPGNNAEAVLAEFNACAQINDLGLKNFFDKQNNLKEIVLSKNKKCVSQCTLKIEDKTDNDVYKCLTTCFDESFKETEKVLKDIKTKIVEVRSNYL
jgi:hypothetical protein